MARTKKAAPEVAAVEETPVAEEVVAVEETPAAEEVAAPAEEPEAPKAEPKKRGRKPGSTNKPKAAVEKAATEFVVQFDGKDADVNAIEERVKAQFVAEGHRAGTIKSLKIYIKPEDYAAYYVINEKFSGRVDLF